MAGDFTVYHGNSAEGTVNLASLVLFNFCLLEGDFAWVTGKIRAVADVYARGRLISVLEGGYSLPALARSIEAHLQALL